jgi:hypothetical protein
MHVPSYFAFLSLALPWLNPLTFGPTHPVVQSLTVWIAAALCVMTWELARVDTPTRIRSIAAAWSVAGTASAAIGLLQYLRLTTPQLPKSLRYNGLDGILLSRYGEY